MKSEANIIDLQACNGLYRVDYMEYNKEIILRKPNKEDIRCIVYQFKGDYFSDSFDIDLLSEKYAKFAEFIVAYYDGNPIGYIAYYCNDLDTFTAYITMVVVKSEFRGQGIATKMLKYVLNDCKEHGFKTCRLEVNNINIKAICLYEKMGFKFASSAGNDSSYYTTTLDQRINYEELIIE